MAVERLNVTSRKSTCVRLHCMSIWKHYGFKTRKCPPQSSELEAFERDMMEIINKLTF